MFLIFVIFVLIVFAVMTLIGTILVIFGFKEKRKPPNIRRKRYKPMITIGVILLAIPAGTFLLINLTALKSTILSRAAKNAKYDNIVEKWQKSGQYINEDEAAADAVKALLESADSGDKQAFKKNFTEELQDGVSFNNDVNRFFESYPQGLSKCELNGGLVSSDGDYDNGNSIENGYTHYTCTIDGEWYGIYLSFCYENTKAEKEVGVTKFQIENLQANALNEEYDESDLLLCNVLTDEQISERVGYYATARLIADEGIIFRDTGYTPITEEEFKTAVNRYSSLTDFYNAVGRPPGEKKYSNATGTEIYYDIISDDGSPLYAHLCVGGDKIYYGFFCSDRETLYDKELYKGE